MIGACKAAGAWTLTRGHLRAAAHSATHVMQLLAEPRRRHGGLAFSLRIGNSSNVLRQIVDHDADVAIMARRTSDPRIRSPHLRADKLVLFVPMRMDGRIAIAC